MRAAAATTAPPALAYGGRRDPAPRLRQAALEARPEPHRGEGLGRAEDVDEERTRGRAGGRTHRVEGGHTPRRQGVPAVEGGPVEGRHLPRRRGDDGRQPEGRGAVVPDIHDEALADGERHALGCDPIGDGRARRGAAHAAALGVGGRVLDPAPWRRGRPSLACRGPPAAGPREAAAPRRADRSPPGPAGRRSLARDVPQAQRPTGAADLGLALRARGRCCGPRRRLQGGGRPRGADPAPAKRGGGRPRPEHEASTGPPPPIDELDARLERADRPTRPVPSAALPPRDRVPVGTGSTRSPTEAVGSPTRPGAHPRPSWRRGRPHGAGGAGQGGPMPRPVSCGSGMDTPWGRRKPSIPPPRPRGPLPRCAAPRPTRGRESGTP